MIDPSKQAIDAEKWSLSGWGIKGSRWGWVRGLKNFQQALTIIQPYIHQITCKSQI